MKLEPKLIDVAVPANPDGAVLVLHGGAQRREAMAVSPTQLSVLRMVPIARRIARRDRRRLAVFRLLNSARGWDTRHTPLHDATWALAQIADRLGDGIPSCLVGHSLGGRAALLSAGRPGVRGVVALAPWVYPDDLPSGLSDQRVLILHGSADRIASPTRSAAVARALSRRVPVEHVVVEGGRHAMLRHGRRFVVPAADFAVEVLLG
ncbi:MAG: alpha/beta fold hydrolase [Solirubrobacterales bacterium]|nr:alpha/beta fold hydrolase [Solirubrobacterales bacterium]